MAPAGRRQGDPRTRDTIIEAARAEFLEHGYTATTIRAIARRAAVTISIVVAGAAGIVISPFTVLTPDIGSTYLISAFAVVIVGGIGNALGAVLAIDVPGGRLAATHTLPKKEVPGNLLLSDHWLISQTTYEIAAYHLPKTRPDR